MQVDHANIARAVYGADPPPATLEGALGYVTRLLAALPPDEQAGYLLKPDGENVAPLTDGTRVSVSRVCYPDGQLYKVMTNAPAGDPEWADDGTVPAWRYHAFAAGAPPVPAPTPAPTPLPDDDAVLSALVDLARKVDALSAQLDANTEKIQQQIDQVVKNAEATFRMLLPIVEAALPALSGLFARR